jgi:hypothetical protein
MGRDPESLMANPTMVLWTTRWLGLEMVIAFRGGQRYETPHPFRVWVQSGSLGVTCGDFCGRAKSCLSPAGATHDDWCRGVKSCMFPVGATDGGSYGDEKLCLLQLNRRWWDNEGRRGGMHGTSPLFLCISSGGIQLLRRRLLDKRWW